MSIIDRISNAVRSLMGANLAESAPGNTEQRSIENPAYQVSAAQLDLLAGYGPTSSGVQINESTAMTIVAVYAAHKIIGETMGMLPWAVFSGDEDDKQRVKAKEHPAYAMLRRSPNPEMTPFTFRETESHHCMGWGNCYARIISDNAGRARQMWPMAPSQVFPERKAGRLMYRIRGQAQSDAGTDALDHEEVFHVPGLSFDGIKGYSPILMAREALGSGKAAEMFAASFWGNGTRLSGHLEYPGRLKPEAIANLAQSFAEKHTGSGNAHKTAVFEEGMKWVKDSCAPEEAQFLQTRQFSVVDIARLYRIPPHMLADQGRATHSNIEQASLEFLIYTMAPWFAKFESEADRKLMGSGEFFAKFDERQLLRTDMAGRRDYLAMARQWGMFSPNDALRFEGDEPIGPQGDTYLTPINMQNAKITAKQTEPPAPAAAGASVKGSGGASGNSPFGGADANRADANRAREFAARTTRVVFEDAMQRMLRKEMHAQGNGKATDHFYAEHRKHVAEALSPAISALRNLLSETGVSIDTAAAANLVDTIAAERHTNLNGNAAEIATETADAIINAMAPPLS